MEPLAISVAETVKVIGLGRTKIHELLANGRLHRVKIGRRTLITRASIVALFAGEV